MFSSKRRLVFLAVFVTSFVCANPAAACQAPVAYTDRATWFVAAGGSTTLVNFESLPLNVPITTELAPFGVALVSGTSSFETPPGPTMQMVSTSTALPFPMFTAGTLPSETQFLSNRMTPGVYACGQLRFDFAGHITAVGMYPAGLMTVAQFVVELYDGATLVGSITVPGMALPNSFVGVVSAQPFTSALCYSTNPADSWGLDDLEFSGNLAGGFCSGDGTATACPCGNVGAAGNGCASSVTAAGARLFGSGLASIGADSFVLHGTLMPNSSALYFQGTGQTAGGQGTVFGDGLRCASGIVIRLGAELNVNGTSIYPAAGDVPISIKGANSAGSLRTYQIWYRNAAPYCSPATFNLSNGFEVTWSA